MYALGATSIHKVGNMLLSDTQIVCHGSHIENMSSSIAPQQLGQC